MPGDGRDEERAVEPVEPDRSAGRDAGGSAHVAQERDLAERLRGSHHARLPVRRRDQHLAVGDDVEPVAGVARAEERFSRREVDLRELVRDRLEHRRRQRREHRLRADEPQPLPELGIRPLVEPPQRAPREGDRDRQHEADDHERPACAGHVDEERRDERTGSGREVGDPLERARHTREHAVGHRPLHQRVAGDVGQRVAEAEREVEDDREHELGLRADHDQRDPPEQDPDAEHRREAAAADKADRADRAGDAAEAHRGVQVADLRRPAAEHRLREHDVQHAERAGDEGLRREEADEQGETAGSGRSP